VISITVHNKFTRRGRNDTPRWRLLVLGLNWA
jgi:hypothetical protein